MKPLLLVGFFDKIGKLIAAELEQRVVARILRTRDLNKINIGVIPDWLSAHYQLTPGVEEFFETFHTLSARRGPYFDNFPKLRNEFMRLCAHVEGLLADQAIDTVIFSNLPHEGFDYIVYQLARRRGLRTVLLHQTIFPGRFFLVEAIEDIAAGNDRRLSLFEPLDAESSLQKKLSYMKGVPGFSNRKEVLAAKTKRIVRFGQRWTTMPRKPSRELLGHRVAKVPMLLDDVLYRKRRDQYFTTTLDDLDRNQNHVYVPLQYQPELTTSILGGEYEDQLMMVERLRLALPDTWTILVKENPKQRAYYRSREFFERLESIPGVRGLAPSAASRDIIAMADLTSVVTGTAGWEALNYGKPCLCFGHAWYLGFTYAMQHEHVLDDLPGAVARMTTSDIAARTRDEFVAFSRSLGLGVLNDAYATSVPDFDGRGNGRMVSDSLFVYLEAKREAATTRSP